MSRVQSVPTWYRGTRFASTLEADWAATFDLDFIRAPRAQTRRGA